MLEKPRYLILSFLVDGVGGDRSFERTAFLSREVRRDIIASGFTIMTRSQTGILLNLLRFWEPFQISYLALSVFPREELVNLKLVCRNAPRANLFKPVPLSPDGLLLCHIPLGILRGC